MNFTHLKNKIIDIVIELTKLKASKIDFVDTFRDIGIKPKQVALLLERLEEELKIKFHKSDKEDIDSLGDILIRVMEIKE